MLSYQNLLRDVLSSGKGHEDRTGVGTISLFGYQWSHDMTLGFPLLTTKFVPLRVVFEELMWFLRGSTNNRELVEKNVHIWDEWQNPEDGELGPVYGKQWRNQECIRYIKVDHVMRPESQIFSRFFDEISPKEDTGDPLVGCSFDSSTGRFTVIDVCRIVRSENDEHTRASYKVQFSSSGYVADGVTSSSVKEGSVRDPYFQSFCGVAAMGDVSGVTNGEKHPLLETWKGMIKRCYDTDHEAYGIYGGKGVWVCDRWLLFSNFVSDFKLIENWELKAEYPDEYTLDKDGCGSNVYSVSTCAFISKKEQSINTSDASVFRATSPTGDTSLAIGASIFAKSRGLTKQCILGCLRGRQSHHKGWRFEPLTCPDGYVPRYFHCDQIKGLMAQMMHSSNSRRLIVSAWNPLETGKMALAPCHTLFQVKIDPKVGSMQREEISLRLDARSIDSFLGLPFNIASYALLLKLLACTTDRVADRLVIQFGDLHIYRNHMSQVEEQLSRTPYTLPNVHIDDRLRGKGFDGLMSATWEDIHLHEYKYHPKISAPVAV